MTQPDRLREALDEHELMTNPAECTCGEWTFRDEKPGNYFNDHLAGVIRAALAAPVPDPIAEHVHDAEVCFGCAEVHERALAEQDIITGHIPASREAAPDLIAAVEALPGGICDLEGALHPDLVGRRVVLALLRSAPASREADR